MSNEDVYFPPVPEVPYYQQEIQLNDEVAHVNNCWARNEYVLKYWLKPAIRLNVDGYNFFTQIGLHDSNILEAAKTDPHWMVFPSDAAYDAFARGKPTDMPFSVYNRLQIEKNKQAIMEKLNRRKKCLNRTKFFDLLCWVYRIDWDRKIRREGLPREIKRKITSYLV